MVVNLYESVLQELGKTLGIVLIPDSNNSCLVRLKNGLEVQFELNKNGDHFMMGTSLGSIPVGRYRDMLFREALKVNGMPPPRPGIFAYSRKADSLIFFRSLLTRDLSGDKVALLLAPFSEKALEWRDAIRRGDIPQFQGPTAAAQANIFGIR